MRWLAAASIFCFLFQRAYLAPIQSAPQDDSSVDTFDFEQQFLSELRDSVYFLLAARLFDAVVAAGPRYVYFYNSGFYDEGIRRINWPQNFSKDIYECSISDLQKISSALWCSKYPLSFRIWPLEALSRGLQEKANKCYLKELAKTNIHLDVSGVIDRHNTAVADEAVSENPGEFPTYNGLQDWPSILNAAATKSEPHGSLSLELRKFRALALSELMDEPDAFSLEIEVIDARMKLNSPLRPDERFDFIRFTG